ncbi:MAG: AMP-binding protein [Sterolibacterium sp.]
MKLDSNAGNLRQRHENIRGQAPAQYNIADACCRRWAGDRGRLALYYEDDAGLTQAWSFWDIQRMANRLSNALGALGTLRGERIAIILPQRPETAIAHIACYQMGTIAVPLSQLLEQDALASRLGQAEARIAIVDSVSLPQLWAIRERLPQLNHIIGVGDALENGVHDWTRLLEYASPRYTPLVTSADDPAMIVDTGATAAKPQGALMAQRTLLDCLPGFIRSHESFPKPDDMFWSPADWASTGGLFEALLPTWNFGQPILGYPGRFDPEKAFWLMAKYGIRNTFLFPDELRMMMQALPKPREKFGPDLNLRTLVSATETLGDALIDWVREELGVAINGLRSRTDDHRRQSSAGQSNP